MIALALQGATVVFMIGSLFGVGLVAAPRDVWQPLKNGQFVAATLVGGWVIAPLTALFVLWLIPIAPPYASALLMLSLAPVAPFAPAMMQIARADAAYAAAFMVLSAVAT